MKLKLTFVLAGVALLVVGLSSVALAAGGLTGTYTTTISSPAELKGKWSLILAKGGAYSVKLGTEVVARGKYTSTAKTEHQATGVAP